MKLSRIVTGFLTVALLAFMVTDTLGQEGGRRGGGRGGEGGGPRGGFSGRGGFGGRGGGGDMTMSLLRVDAVKTELEISSDQQAALTKMAEQGRPERSGANIRDLSQEKRTALFEKLRKEQAERTTKMKEQLEEVLFPEQLERLEQIALQIRGVQALQDEKVAAKLKLSDDQKNELNEVRDGMMQKMRSMFSGGNRENFRETIAKARAEMEEKALGVLNSDQKKQFAEMKGEKFEMPEGAFGGGRGNRGGAGGRGGRGGRGGDGGGGRGGRGGDGGGRRRPQAEE